MGNLRNFETNIGEKWNNEKTCDDWTRLYLDLIVAVAIKLTCDKTVYNYKHIPASPVAQW